MANKCNNHRLLPVLHPVILSLLMFMAFTLNIRSQNITGVEYFFNSDPGFGAGNIIPVVPPAPDIGTFDFDVSISGLNDGFHKLYVRAKDDNGGWSFSNSRSFYKNTIMLGFNNLTKLEYFIDTDPGPGNGTDVPITNGPSIYDLEFSIDVSGLNEGFHQLYVRAKNQAGQWSLASRRQFIMEVVNISNPQVTAAEYFFNSDPGPGQGTTVPVSAGNDVTLDLNIDITSLPEGFHNLYVRVRDSEGYWSLCSRRSFVIEHINVSNTLISEIEYFINIDPGAGQGEPIPFTPSGSVTVIDHVIDINALPSGFHKLYVRAKDNSGNWSLTNIRSFVKQELSTTVPNLVAAEYFFNTDPGFGLGTEISVPSGQHEIDVSFTADISSLSAGFHKLFVRVKDSLDGWSHSTIHPFYKTGDMPQASDIVFAEYFFNADPGFGQGTVIPVPNPGVNVDDLVFEVDISGLLIGNHLFYVRTRDAAGQWSHTLIDEYCKAPLADFSADEVWLGNVTTFTDLSLYTDEYTVYQWDVDGDNITDYTYDHGFTHTYVSEGTYNASLVLTSVEGCTDSIVKPVHVFTCSPPVSLSVSDTTVNSAVLHWDQANMETSWNLEYGLSGFIPGNGILISGLSSTSYQLTNLMAGTSYDTYVQSICYPGSSSSWAGPVTFTTLDEPPAFGPVAFYPFNGNANDASGNNYHGSTVTATLTTDRFGNPNSAYDFDGSSAYITIPFITPFNSNSHTICAWVQTNAATGRIVTFPSGWGQHFSLNSGLPQTGKASIYYDGGGSYSASSITSINDGDWHFVAGVIDAQSVTLSIYIDGVHESTTSADNHPYPGNEFVNIGRFNQSFGEYFTGKIDDVSIYNEALTSGQILTLFGGSLPCSNPTDGGSIASSQTICFGTYPDTLNSISPATGYTGTPEYKWQLSTDNVIYSDIQGAVAADYSPSALTVTTWFRRLAKVTCEPDWTGAAISDTVEITVGNRDQYRTKASGGWNNTAIWEKYNGSEWVDADHYPSADMVSCPNPIAIIRPGDTITVGSVISFGNIVVQENAILEIEENANLGIIAGDTLTVYGTIITHSTAIVSGAGHFALSSGAQIHIGSAEGISVSTATGNIQVTGSRLYASGANYVYIGTGNQFTGDGLMQNTPYNLTVNAPGMVVLLSQSITVSGSIYILNGTLDGNNYDVFLGGNWINNGIFLPGTATVYFNATVNVFISVSNFYNVVFAGTDTITAGGDLTIYGSVVINNYFNAGSWNHYVYGDWTNNGVFINGTSTIHFVGTGNVFIGAGNFYNVVFGGSGTITATGAVTFYGSVVINNYFNAGNFTHYVYGNWTNTGIFVYATSTIQFMGTANIYIGATGFYNVIFGGSGTVTAIGEIIFYGNITINNYFDAGNFIHYVYGNWINNGVFVSGTSTINFTGSNNIYIGVSNFYNIIFTGTGIIQATGSLTITGNMTINTYFDAGSFTHVVSGNWTNNGTFIFNNSTIEFTGNEDVLISGNDFYNVIFGGTGTFTATGPINFYGDVTINNYFNAGSYTHYVYGNWINNGTFVYGTSTLIFSGTTNITIGVSNFYNVIFGGTGNVTAIGSLTIYGDITIENYFDAGSYEHFVHGNWINNGVFIYGTSTIHFVVTTNIYLGGYSFYNIVFGGAGTVIATGSLTIYGDITINNYFDAGSYTHYVYGNWINNGTFVYGTSTIQFIGSGNIVIGISNFYHIVFGGTGTITATGSLTIWGDVTINNYFNAGSFTHYVHGNWINNGTFVYGTSTIYFEATVNIYITVNEFYNVVFAGSGNYIATGSITFYGNVTINNYFDAGSYVHYVYGNWINNGIFVYGTSTIYFMGSGNVFVGTGNFYHIIFGGAGTITASGSLTIYGDVTINNYFDGGSYVHFIYGNWINNGVFVYNTSTIQFVGTGNITIGNSEFYHIIFGGTGTIVATGSLTIWGDITINNYFDAGSYVHIIYGNWINNGIFVYGTSTIHFNGSINLFINESEFYHVIFGGSGTITALVPMIFYGDVTINNYFDAGNLIHYVYGSWTNNGTFIYGTSTIHFVGVGTIYIGTGSFYHIVFGGTGTIIASGSLTIYGDVTINNYFDAGSYVHYVYGNWINNGTFVYGTSTIHFSASINIYIGQNEFYHVIFGGTGNYVATGPITFYGDVTINNYFDAGIFTHFVYGSWINNGNFVYGTSTIYFMGSGNVYIGTGNFYHIIFGGTGTVTASGSLTIYGNITINNHFDGGSYVHYIYGNWINNGVFVYNTSTIHFVGALNRFLGTSAFYHVIFGGSGIITASGSLTIYGDVTILNHFHAGSYTHYLRKRWINNGIFEYGTSTVIFDGTEQQIIEGSEESVFYAFGVNNPQGILLNVNVSVYFNLILTQGIITTGNYLYTIMPYGSITGGSASAYIHGRLVCGYNTLSSRIFPVGTASLFGPMTFNYVTLSGTSMVQVEFVEGTIPGNVPGYYNSVAGHYWIISQTGGTGFTFTVTLNVTGYSPLGSIWILNSDGVNVSGWPTTFPNYTNTTVFTTFGYFTLGEQYCPVPGGLINRYVTNTTAILDWEAGFSEQSWNVEYGPQGFTPGTGTMLSDVTEKPLEIIGLVPEAYYEFYVQSVCSDEIQSSWVGPEPFSTFPKQLDATVFIEGPYNESTGLMGTILSGNGWVPLSQPYNQAPWNYAGNEQVSVIPENVVDWVLIEWREASSPALANSSTWIWRKAAFLKNDGSIVDPDGSTLLWIGNPQLSDSLYFIVRHRNHLDVIANYGAVLNGDVYSYDFSDQPDKMFGGTNAFNQIGTSPERYGMAAGDGNADGQVVQLSDVPVWRPVAGEKGYYPGDYNMDGQVQNQDKNDVMYPNRGKYSAVP